MSGRREELRDSRGSLVATFARGSDHGLPLVRDIRIEGSADEGRLVDAIARELRDHVVMACPQIAESLIARGASVRRRSVAMSCRPCADHAPAARADIAITVAAGVSAEDLLDAYIDAYPPGHSDHHALDRDRQRAALQELIDGAVIGPMMGCSRVALVGGRPVGAALVFDASSDTALGMPWLGELFRDPSAPRGTGAAMLGTALAAAAEDGVERVGLRVTESNPALALYERLGFTETRRLVAVLVAPA